MAKYYSIWEEGMVHTSKIREKEADQLLARLQSCFPDTLFFKAEWQKNEPKH
jgi:hypothetical protein